MVRELGDQRHSHTNRLSESQVRAAVVRANVPSLLMVVFQTTGDERWLGERYRPTRGKGLDDHDSGGLPTEVQDEIREAAAEAILRLQDGHRPAIERPDPELTTRMVSAFVGEHVDPAYGPMLADEFARRVYPEAAESAVETVPAPDGFRVIVIGAGLGGIVAARQLEDMGIDYVIVEKESAPGGTWWVNSYPGAGVDTPSHLYSFSFAPHDWARHFELRDDIHAYFARVLKDVNGEEHVRYRTEALRAWYDDGAKGWNVEVRNPDGTDEVLHGNVLISAVGVLSRPVIPDIPGRETFPGPSFHTAQWPSEVELGGKRVAVVGTGASAMQVVPAIADRVAEVVVFQRSPQWVAPFEKFMQPIPDELRMLLQSCPLYRGWYWIRLFWQFGDNVIQALRVDPEWEHPERSVNARNDGHREYFTRYIKDQLAGREDLVPKVLPDYPPFGKRILLDNGWYQAIRRPNVTLFTEGVSQTRGSCVIGDAGTEYDAEVLIWATGFDAARFVSSLDIRGIGGIRLREVWDDDNPTAYLGISVPRFPNFFMLGGPNSFPGSGSFMFYIEQQMRYIGGLLTEMFKDGAAAVDADETLHDEYNELVDRTHARTVWTHPGMSTYFRNARGRVVFLSPFLGVEYWHMLQRPHIDHYTRR